MNQRKILFAHYTAMIQNKIGGAKAFAKKIFAKVFFFLTKSAEVFGVPGLNIQTEKVFALDGHHFKK